MAKKAQQKTDEQSAQPATEAVVIQSVEQLDLALKEWGELNAQESALQQSVKLKVNKLLTDCQSSMVVNVDGKSVSIQSRRASLEAAVRAYSIAHRTELLAGLDTKSRKLTHGIIQWRGQPEKLVDVEASKSNSTASQFIESLVKAARKALKAMKLALFPDLLCTEVVSIKVEWNHTLLFEKYKSGEISLQELKVAGFNIEGGEGSEDNFSAKPTEVLVKSEAAETSEKP